jgi:hypothetical protein
MQEVLRTTVSGHVLVTDRATGEVLVDNHNAIHPQNMATAIARGLSNSANFQIFKMKLGNQGTYIDNTQQIVFRPANTIGNAADLYNPTWVEVVDESQSSIGVGNSVVFSQVPLSTTSRVIVTAIIASNEAINNPTDGGDGDPSLNPEGNFFFDELGLFTKQTTGTDFQMNPDGELMLTHLIFSPIEHTGNRELTIVYTLTISVS